ncbi:hypothetical protein NQ317_019466 [Molorchus minor]|uniref:MADF domain-containing protein n=1 Tax=Molorchus minor TaxID=1323400 RepID=A0ABQ9JPW7_9CUCU|nr:hypothetical protein NQ317_019466 [Molorchus minor]
MSFHENLILQVQNYKELYDLSDRYYSNHQRKEEIWREIAEQVGETKRWWLVPHHSRKIYRNRSSAYNRNSGTEIYLGLRASDDKNFAVAFFKDDDL